MTERRVLLAAALDYADRGWHVFPLSPGSKAPALPQDWQNMATTDPVLIRSWWGARSYNIGVSVGQSRLFVIDLDAPHPAEPDRSQTAGQPATSATIATAQVNPVADGRAVAGRT